MVNFAKVKLKVLSLVNVGYNHVDPGYCRRRGIIITNTGTALTETLLAWTFTKKSRRCIRNC